MLDPGALLRRNSQWGDDSFLSVDPLVSDAWDPQAYNAYAYARNNPISNIDPTGMGCLGLFIFGTFCTPNTERPFYTPPSFSAVSNFFAGTPTFGAPSALGANVAVASATGVLSGGGNPSTQPGLSSTGAQLAGMAGAMLLIPEPTVSKGTAAALGIAAVAITVGPELVRQMQVMQQSGEESADEEARESEFERRTRQLEAERQRINRLKDEFGRTNKGDKGPRKSLQERLKEARARFKGHAKALLQKFGKDVGPPP